MTQLAFSPTRVLEWADSPRAVASNEHPPLWA